ncbi:MAG: tetratricopeptide repeat protein, partial [Rhodococcus sp.]|nr:tetratricopeptide repeat protein [Rhodococcus sp. (in: high G+C Gram-positive bacteria)]
MPSSTLFDTAIGRCGLAWSADGVMAVALPEPSDEAMLDYQRSALALPGHEKTRFGAGLVALELGRREEAIAHFRAAVAINPHHPGYQHQLAVALLRDGDAAGA